MTFSLAIVEWAGVLQQDESPTCRRPMADGVHEILQI